MISTGTLSPSAAGRRAALSRVTLVGERRRIDLVLPSREPIGVLLPEIMRLLDDRVGARPESRHLVTTDGSALEPGSSLASAGVPDGAVLRLVRVQDAPSAPVVHDVSDEVADDLDVRAWRWRPAVRRVVAGIATVFWAVAAGVLARGQFDLAAVGAGLLAVAGAGALAGVLCGRARLHGLATTLIATAGALAVLAVWTCADAYDWSGPQRLAGLAVASAIALVLAGWFTPLGRGALFGAAAVGGCLVLWEVAAGLQGGAGDAAGQARAGALLAASSVVVLGVLPRLALMASGLTGLDDRRTGGASVSRYQVATALAATHRGLAIATVVLAASAAAAGVMVLRSVTVWTVLLSVMVMVALGLRARAFPLTAEVVVLLVAASVVTVRLVVTWLEHTGTGGPIAALSLLAIVPLVVLSVEPAEHVRVRLRRLGDVLESTAVIAMLPLVIGVFGVYGRLLGTFA
ncbi:type VII secretion integral membrane protein EccD [Streptomyces sp. SS1-1]|uniref:type VII secretion integral membrane protein EccD n=1 Tax=Streptomyces sp. SS1-1 TaxID=2651869 RepID=UPI0012504740|nr:type VII secretion integral membrane protein EccD [Streptomyces sp. SS1-1]KAB2972462.1 type VII secretion integral membrane protein EccD [Streptomyces sp. SS1-1]